MYIHIIMLICSKTTTDACHYTQHTFIFQLPVSFFLNITDDCPYKQQTYLYSTTLFSKAQVQISAPSHNRLIQQYVLNTWNVVITQHILIHDFIWLKHNLYWHLTTQHILIHDFIWLNTTYWHLTTQHILIHDFIWLKHNILASYYTTHTDSWFYLIKTQHTGILPHNTYWFMILFD